MLEGVPKSSKRSFNVFITAVKSMRLTLLEICICEKSIMKLQRLKETAKLVTSSRNVGSKTTMKLCLNWVFWLNNSKNSCKTNFWFRLKLSIIILNRKFRIENDQFKKLHWMTKPKEELILIFQLIFWLFSRNSREKLKNYHDRNLKFECIKNLV